MADGSDPILETLGAFVVVFALSSVLHVVGAASIATGLFVLAPPVVDNPWTIVTSVYAHVDVAHLVSNSIGLVLFGWLIARRTTRLRFHTFFIVTGALAGLSQVLIRQLVATIGVGEPSAVLGASGAVFALMGYLITGNRVSEAFGSSVQVPPWLTLTVFAGLAAAITILTGAPGVALIAHFTGFMLGLLAGRAKVLEPRGGRVAA